MPSEPILPPSDFSTDKPIAGREEIRRYVPQRNTFEMLHGILHYDPENGVAVGYRDVLADEHWVDGHVPGMPLFPGVLMIETSAQLCGYLFHRMQTDDRFFAFGGVDSVRFRGTVEPGDQVVVMSQALRLRRHLGHFRTQAFVGDKMVYEGLIMGVVLNDAPRGSKSSNSAKA